VLWPGEFPDFYWDVFHPLTLGDKKPVSMGSLVDDLIDIYVDVKPPLIAWNSDHQQDAVREWRLSFRSHWHRHATSALKVLVIVGVSAARPGGEGAPADFIDPPNASIG
jgi:hypothetical protein